MCALVLGVKLYFVQVVYGDEFNDRADRQYVQTTRDLFSRGSIYFTDKRGGHVSAATLKTGYVLAINPRLIDDAAGVYEKLSEYIDLDKDNFFLRAGKDDPYEELAHRLTEEEADAISALEIDGVNLYKERWRFYPGRDLASHTLGFVGFKGDLLEGRYGAEEYWDSTLSQQSDNLYINFFAEVFSQVGETIVHGNSHRSGDIYLTIEPTVQRELEERLREVQKAWNSKMVAGIIMDPQTGAIQAMGVTPSFDPNTYNEVDDVGVFTNPLVQNVYEMGSIIKPITVAAGLDARVITPKTTYNDRGTLEVNGQKISNYDKVARGVVDMQEVLNQSLNTGVSFIVEELGNARFSSYMRSFGVQSMTNIDLPGEVAGLTENLSSPRDIEHFTASYGQGIALTPIATVRSLAALANGGKLVTPHVTNSIEYDIGYRRDIEKPITEGVIRPETSEEISRMLVAVVDDALKDGKVKNERYSVAAKTGTAQIPAPTGGYYDDRFLHSFFGYFPAYEAKHLIFLMNLEPQGGVRYASETLTDPFVDLVDFLITFYQIPPDR